MRSKVQHTVYLTTPAYRECKLSGGKLSKKEVSLPRIPNKLIFLNKYDYIHNIIELRIGNLALL
jgi:hypothetical protein